MEEDRKQTPLVSVLILTYNHEKYLEQSVNGALMQKCNFLYEIVICDDCSSDKTRDIATSLQKKYPNKIKLVFNEKNKGFIRNYYESIEESCSGKYIADCPGDDYWIREDKLQMQVDILEKHPDIALVHTNWMEFLESTNEFLPDAKSNKRDPKPQILDKSYLDFILNQRDVRVIHLNTSCIRRNVMVSIYHKHKHLFDPSLYPCEDFQFVLLLLRESKAYYIDIDTIVYRIHDESVSSNSDLLKFCSYKEKFLLLKIRLSTEFNIDITRFLEEETAFIFRLAYRAKNPAFALRAKELIDNSPCDFKYPLKSRIIYNMTIRKGLFNVSYPIYIFLRSLKRLVTGNR